MKKHPEFTPPKRIWLQPFDEDGEPNEICGGGITWCEDHQYDTDVEYVRVDNKTAVLCSKHTVKSE